MSNAPREIVPAALKAYLQESVPEFRTISRRIKPPGSIAGPDCPALMIDEVSELVQQVGQRPVWKSTLLINLWIVLKNDRDPNSEPIVASNTLIDKIEAAFAPPPCFDSFTLGGLCEYCRIEGTIEKDAGEIGGVAMAIVPLRILIP